MRLKKTVAIVGCVLLCISLINLLLFLNKYNDVLLDSDDASEMMLAHLLSEKGGILSKDWYYASELRVLNTQLARIPFFYFCNNWHIVRMLGNIVLYIVLSGCLYRFCNASNCKYLFPMICSAVFIPFSSDHFNFILRGGYYIPHISISLVMISFTIEFGNPNSIRTKRIRLMLVGIILSFLAGLGGLRQLFVFYMPIVVAVFLFYWIYRETPIRAKQYVYFTIPTSFAAILGFYVNNHYLRKVYYFEDKSIVHYTRIWAETVFKIINGWILNLGYCQGGGIFSFDTISNFLCGFIIILCTYSIYLILHYRERYSDGNLITVLFFSSGMILFFLFYSCTDAIFEPRYISPFTFFMIPIIYIGLMKAPFKRWNKIVAIGALMSLMTICSINYYKKTIENTSTEYIEISEFLTANGYKNGYSTFWDGNVLTELSNGQINAWVWGILDEDVENLDKVYPWLQYKSHTLCYPTGKTYVLLRTADNEKFTISSYFSENDVIYQSDFHIIYGFESYEKLNDLFKN